MVLANTSDGDSDVVGGAVTEKDTVVPLTADEVRVYGSRFKAELIARGCPNTCWLDSNIHAIH
jgi:hypothetical protein